MRTYEQYPKYIIFITNLLAVIIYALGVMILLPYGLLAGILYLCYAFWLEMRLFRKACVHCHYYGKRCAFGKGTICSFLFKKGDPKKFTETEFSWKQLIPDFMVTLIPLIAGTVILILNYSTSLLVLMVLLLVLSFVGNGYVRGQLACKYCKQRELGCPAEQLFKGRTSRASPPKAR